MHAPFYSAKTIKTMKTCFDEDYFTLVVPITNHIQWNSDTKYPLGKNEYVLNNQGILCNQHTQLLKEISYFCLFL